MDGKKQKQVEVLRKIEELREQRRAKEKARLDKLRAINIEKYKSDDNKLRIFQTPKLPAFQSKPNNFESMPDLRRKSLIPRPVDNVKNDESNTKNIKVISNNAKKSLALDNPSKHIATTDRKPDKVDGNSKRLSKFNSVMPNNESVNKIHFDVRKSILGNTTAKDILKIASSIKLPVTTKSVVTNTALTKAQKMRQSIAPVKTISAPNVKKTEGHPRVSIKPPIPKMNVQKTINDPKAVPKKTPNTSAHQNNGGPKMNVFERLYKSKSNITASNRKETIFEQKNRLVAAHATNRRSLAPMAVAKENVKKMRRSISAVHFKRIGKDELQNCYHRYASMGEGLNKIDINKINEDEESQARIVNTVRSERKKVKFQTATPRAEELNQKLKLWLQKRGKSLDSFQHLRCFGIHRLTPAQIDSEPLDEENKENIAVSISDDGSYHDLMNEDESKMQWRRADSFNDSEMYSECAESENKSPTSAMTPVPKAKVDEVLLSALTDLSQLVREGYDWEQSARWLRAIRDRCPHATSLAAYWECRAALEEHRGNLPRSWLCWEEAIAKGTQASVAEASIDHLLEKFMQLNISPERAGAGGRPSLSRQDMLSAKSIFKSSLIRFAVENAKAKKETAKYTITPVRRSSRINGQATPTPRVARTPHAARTPLLQLASSLRHIDEDIRDKSVFIPNKLLQYSP